MSVRNKLYTSYNVVISREDQFPPEILDLEFFHPLLLHANPACNKIKNKNLEIRPNSRFPPEIFDLVLNLKKKLKNT